MALVFFTFASVPCHFFSFFGDSWLFLFCVAMVNLLFLDPLSCLAHDALLLGVGGLVVLGDNLNKLARRDRNGVCCPSVKGPIERY